MIILICKLESVCSSTDVRKLSIDYRFLYKFTSLRMQIKQNLNRDSFHLAKIIFYFSFRTLIFQNKITVKIHSLVSTDTIKICAVVTSDKIDVRLRLSF